MLPQDVDASGGVLPNCFQYRPNRVFQRSRVSCIKNMLELTKRLTWGEKSSLGRRRQVVRVPATCRPKHPIVQPVG